MIRFSDGTEGTSIARLAAVLACVACGSLACVTSGSYEAMVAERDALATEKDSLEQQIDMHEQRATELGASQQQLAQVLAEREQDVAKLQGTYDDLVSDLQSELDSGKVQIEQLANGIRLSVADEILFASGSAELDEQGREILGKVAAQVTSSPHRVQVIGHTDDLPIRSTLQHRYPSNWELGGARAASVVRLLNEQGVEGKRLNAISAAEFNPVAANDSEADRSRNRRIEIRLMPLLDDDSVDEDVAQNETSVESASPTTMASD